MKTVNYCKDCVTLTNENDHTCTTCSSPILVITNPKLIEMLSEISAAVSSLNESIQSNPKQVKEIAKIIDKGESKLSKEYLKRVDQITTLNEEITILQTFAHKMKFVLDPYESESEPETVEQEETENESVS